MRWSLRSPCHFYRQRRRRLLGRRLIINFSSSNSHKFPYALKYFYCDSLTEKIKYKSNKANPLGGVCVCVSAIWRLGSADFSRQPWARHRATRRRRAIINHPPRFCVRTRKGEIISLNIVTLRKFNSTTLRFIGMKKRVFDDFHVAKWTFSHLPTVGGKNLAVDMTNPKAQSISETKGDNFVF